MMGRRWRSSGKHTGSRKKIFFFSMVVMLFFMLQSLVYIEKNLRAPLLNIAEVRVKQMATQSINQGVANLFAQGNAYGSLINWQTDKTGKNTGFVLNYAEQMKMTAETIRMMQNIMNDLKTAKEYIPFGMAFNSSILASFGPDIPIHFVPAGDVQVEMDTRSQNAGINTVLVEVYMHIVAEVTIIIPFESAPQTIVNDVPISYVLVVGDTPMYYVDSQGNPIGSSNPLPPNISLPGPKASSSPH